MPTLSPLCRLNGGCMGCCGHDFLSKEKVKAAIRKNTSEFNQINPRTEEEFLKFRNREDKSNLRNGVCRNLIEDDGCYLCSLHPTVHRGKDLRIGHCDVNHLCQTAKVFAAWSDEKKRRFITFIENKKITNLDYSLLMDNDGLLKEFS